MFLPRTFPTGWRSTNTQMKARLHSERLRDSSKPRTDDLFGQVFTVRVRAQTDFRFLPGLKPSERGAYDGQVCRLRARKTSGAVRNLSFDSNSSAQQFL